MISLKKMERKESKDKKGNISEPLLGDLSIGLSVHLRLQVVIMLAVGHGDEGILEIRLASFLLAKPYLTETLPADTPAEMSMELLRESNGRSVNSPSRNGRYRASGTCDVLGLRWLPFWASTMPWPVCSTHLDLWQSGKVDI